MEADCYTLKIQLCTLYYSELKMTEKLWKHVFKKWRQLRVSVLLSEFNLFRLNSLNVLKNISYCLKSG